MGTRGSFPGVKLLGVKLATHLLMLRSRMRGIIPPPQYVSVGWCLVKYKDNFTFTFTESRLALGPTQPPIQRVSSALSPGLKLPWLEADHSPPSSAEVKNTGSYTFTPHTSSWRGSWLSTGTTFLCCMFHLGWQLAVVMTLLVFWFILPLLFNDTLLTSD
jgi:hypothetical protein